MLSFGVPMGAVNSCVRHMNSPARSACLAARGVRRASRPDSRSAHRRCRREHPRLMGTRDASLTLSLSRFPAFRTRRPAAPRTLKAAARKSA